MKVTIEKENPMNEVKKPTSNAFFAFFTAVLLVRCVVHTIQLPIKNAKKSVPGELSGALFGSRTFEIKIIIDSDIPRIKPNIYGFRFIICLPHHKLPHCGLPDVRYATENKRAVNMIKRRINIPRECVHKTVSQIKRK